MATLEQVEKLRERANVSYDEAKAALDATNGDLLEAMIYLEKQGKVRSPSNDGFYSSDNAGDKKSNANGAQNAGQSKDGANAFGEGLKNLFKLIGKIIHWGNVNTFEVLKKDEVKAAFPLTVLALLLIFVFWVTIPLIIIGLFFGLRYRFSGPNFDKGPVNSVMDSVADAADNIKNSFNKDN